MNRLLAASIVLSACIIPDREIDVVNEDIQNKQAVRIVEPIELTEDAELACELAAKEADMLAESCPLPGIKPAPPLPNFLDPSVSAYNFCACDPGERHKSIPETTLYVEDRDDRKKEGPDKIYAALQLDVLAGTRDPHQYVRYTDYVNPQVQLPDDDQLGIYNPVKRPDITLRAVKLSMDPCNDLDALDKPLARGYHTLRLVVTDRPWYTNDEGETQNGVPDLAAGATYDTRVYVFHCNQKTVGPGMSTAEEEEAKRCQVQCVAEGL